MKRLNTVGLVLLSVLATSTVASASEGHRPRKAQAKPWKVIRLIERVREVTSIDGGAPGPSLGDRIVLPATCSTGTATWSAATAPTAWSCGSIRPSRPKRAGRALLHRR
jgi:hypothetical protein